MKQICLSEVKTHERVAYYMYVKSNSTQIFKHRKIISTMSYEIKLILLLWIDCFTDIESNRGCTYNTTNVTFSKFRDIRKKLLPGAFQLDNSTPLVYIHYVY